MMETLAIKKLQSLLRTRAVRTGATFVLASGQSSNVFVDCKKLSLHGPSLLELSKTVLDILGAQSPKPNVIAGVSIGGDPLVAGIILEAARQGWELEGLLVRKEVKDHGATKGRAVEGVPPQAGQTVWLVEDVVTSGKSSLDASHKLKSEGYVLSGVLCLVDRELGGVESLRNTLRVPVLSLSKLSQISG